MTTTKTHTEKCADQAVTTIDRYAEEAARILYKHCGTFTGSELLNLVDKLQNEAMSLRDYI